MKNVGGTMAGSARISPRPITSSFKSVSREQKAAWGNRFVRDHNDLIYNADPNSIANKFKAIPKEAKQKIQNEEEKAASKYEYSPIKQRQQAKSSQSQRDLGKGLNINNYMNSVHQIEKSKKNLQQTAATNLRKTRFHQQPVEVKGFNDYEAVQSRPHLKKQQDQQNIQQIIEYQPKTLGKSTNLLGLSKFEFSATIEGRLSRSNHHIDFGRNKTAKINNVNKVWYDESKDIQKPQEIKLREKSASVQRIHSFKSYEPHKLFHKTRRMMEDNGCGNGGMLDKFYQIHSPQKYDINHSRTVKDNVNYRAMTARPDLPKKLGTNLEYKVQKVHTMGGGNGKRAVMQMSNSARKLVFSRQVISPSRGCFR